MLFQCSKLPPEGNHNYGETGLKSNLTPLQKSLIFSSSSVSPDKIEFLDTMVILKQEISFFWTKKVKVAHVQLLILVVLFEL